jgi:hypothetical protein
MAKFTTLDRTILELLEDSSRNLKVRPLNLGGVKGPGGGLGTVPGGFIGWLPQTRVAYDEDEFATLDTPASGMSILDNLNHIRARIGIIESGGVASPLTVEEYDGSPSVDNVDKIILLGGTVTDLGGGEVLITVSGGVGGGIEEAPIDGSTYGRRNGGWVTVSGGGGGGGTAVIIDDLTPQIDGVEDHFDLSSVSISGSLRLYYNGIRQRDSYHYTLDPSLDGITTSFTPEVGDVLIADYNDTSAVISGGSSSLPDRTFYPSIHTDFLESTAQIDSLTYVIGGLYGSIVSNGSPSSPSGEVDHPGLLGLRCGTNANSGFGVLYRSTGIKLNGLEHSEFIFRIDLTTGLLFKAGMVIGGVSDPFGGVWINISSTTLTGKTANASTVSTTSSSYTTSDSVWYRGKIETNSDASVINYFLYDMSGSLLWSDTLSTNIPTSAIPAGGIHAYKTTSSGADTLICTVDWLAFWSEKLLNR